jgi:beta-lactamase regulating signal transducer with metallopeptidase domain
MNFAAQLFSQRIVAALGWTLFHSLWQGALAALGFALILYFSRRGSARARYALGLVTLLLVLAASVATFRSHYAQFGPAPAGIAAVAAGDTSAAAGETAAVPARAERETPSPARRLAAFFSDYFSRNLPLIVTLWLLGVLFLSLRFAGGLLYIERLKYRQSRPLPEPWPGRLKALAAKAGLRRPLRLLESLRLRTPVVVGHLKPVLLLPAGLVTGLAPDEVEALLAHELAHVMRRDYLVNVAQNLVDILYFFHPGVRWVSACVRQEREHCCDDFAVALCGDPRSYARALAGLQVGGPGALEPALAALGRPQRLLRRIARLLGSPRLAHDFREGFLSALLLVAGLLGMLKLAGAAAPAAASTGVKPKPAPVEEDRSQGRFAMVSFVLEADGAVRLSGDQVAGTAGSPGTWLVDDRDGQVVWYMDLSSRAQKGGGASFSEEISLSRGDYSWYRPAGWKATAQWRRADGKGAWEPLTMFVPKGDRLLRRRHDDELLRAEREELLQRERGLAGQEGELKEEERQRRTAELRAREEHERLAREERLLQEEKLRQAEEELAALSGAERERKEKELKKLQHEMQAQAALRDRLREEELRLRAEETRARDLAREKELEEKGMRREADRLREEENKLRAEEERLRAEETKIKKFMAELAAAGLVEEGKSCEIRLSAAALVINGKEQPAAVHEKILRSYETLTGVKLEPERSVTVVNEKD